MGIDRSRVAKRQLRLTHPRVHDEEGNAACKHAMADRENLMLAETLASMKPRQNGGAHWEELAVGMTQGLAKHKSPRGNWRRKKKFATHSGRVRRVDQPTRRPAYFSVTTAWLASSTRLLIFAYGPAFVRCDMTLSVTHIHLSGSYRRVKRGSTSKE